MSIPASPPLIVIPARMASTRLPGKPLADIAGRPMIAWMAGIGRAAGDGPVLVAAAEPEIAAAAEAAGAQAVLTDPALPSGTDRVHAAAEAFDPAGRYEIVVNLQGDMPTFRPADLARAVRLLVETPEADIATLVSPSDDPADRANPNVVKAILALRGEAGRALYFTRAPAPHGEGPVWRHVGLYVYRRAALRRFVAAPPSPLEKRESLEQLRALEMGMRIEAGIVADFPKGVDSSADLEAARTALASRS
ncbi:MAG: 3-deoxy-manno-octulosonate cytidylyltransferase [Hyphomonadaceae bacterium]